MLHIPNFGISGRLPITKVGGRSREVALRPVRSGARSGVPLSCAPAGPARWTGLPSALQQALRPRRMRRGLAPFQVPMSIPVGSCVCQATLSGSRVNRRVPVLWRGPALEQ